MKTIFKITGKENTENVGHNRKINISNYRHKRIRITPDRWHKAAH